MSEILQTDREAWLAERLGCATGSRAADIMSFEFHTYTRGEKAGQTIFEEKAGRRNYRCETTLGRLGIDGDGEFQSRAMRTGSLREDNAVEIYQIETSNEVELCGFIEHPRIPMFGASPDRRVFSEGKRGVLEAKCPTPAIHLRVLKSLIEGILPDEYLPQVQAEICCAGVEFCDFCCFCPLFPINAHFAWLRVMRDEEYIEKLENGVRLFLSEVQTELDWVLNLNGGIA